MAAGDSTSSYENASAGRFDSPGPAELDERLQEEIGRAERHGTSLSCLLVVIDNLEEMAGEGHAPGGGVDELREQTMAYVAGALRREIRRFDRVGLPSDRELLIVLPGADGPRGEMVARRVLDRLRAIKVEARGRREPLRISVGLVAWRANVTPGGMLERARAAAERAGNGNGGGPGAPGPPENPHDEPFVEEPTSPPS